MNDKDYNLANRVGRVGSETRNIVVEFFKVFGSLVKYFVGLIKEKRTR